MDFGVVALIALNNMLFAFLIWVLPRSAVVLAVALGQVVLFGFPLVVHAEPRFWLVCLLRLTWRRFLSGGGLYCSS
jgi:type IV secretory pathway VirB3-like protein